jgi:hypothetical protein
MNTEIKLSAQQISLLDNMLKDMGYHADWCFYVPAEQDVDVCGGYIPAMVFRGVQRYFSMNGPLYGDSPFVIGQTLEEAQARCKKMNQYARLNEEAVEDILSSAGLQTD